MDESQVNKIILAYLKKKGYNSAKNGLEKDANISITSITEMALEKVLPCLISPEPRNLCLSIFSGLDLGRRSCIPYSLF